MQRFQRRLGTVALGVLGWPDSSVNSLAALIKGGTPYSAHLPRMKKSTANMDTRVEPLPNNGGRWSPQRKAALLLALDYDLISLKEAGARFVLSPDEVESWRRQLSRAGVRALRSTRLQHFPECRL